ncbi:MAG: CPBP family intramembrane metalloprotease domain-containing protein [Anaerolineaceae bacterium]|nr:CPBP family intramembrane metalloprotease domain-containing protein [Anaerolineaceae bacterium]
METSTKHNQSSLTSTNLRAKMQRYPLFFFFLIAYLSSWILSVPFILSEWGVLHGDFTIIFAIKSFGPFLAAYVIIRITEGKEGLHRLRQRIKQKQASLVWYLLILLGIPTILMVGIIIQPGALANFQGLNATLLLRYPLTFIVVIFGGGPLGEEPGWRGFALPRMQFRYGPLVGTLLLGVLWTGWHLPDFLTSAQGGGPGTGFSTFLINFPIFFLLVMALAIIFTWIFNHTKGSIFIAVLAHASVNTPQVVLVPLFPSLNTTTLNLAAMIGFGIPALLILLFTRGTLGYPSYQDQKVN